jgi:hypothetical protein
MHYMVDPWESRFRDQPRVVSYFDAPWHLPAGSVLRVGCEWRPGSESVEFPAEMCAMFSYYVGEETLECTPTSGTFIE